MSLVTLFLGLLVPWLAGMSLLLAMPAQRRLSERGELAWIAGTGYFVGAFLLTLWMRALSQMGIDFGGFEIGVPLLAVAVGGGYLAWRRAANALPGAIRFAGRALLSPPGLSGVARWAWRALLAWIALRFLLLGLEVSWQPLFPWNAWSQWATKARVWFELGRIVPFADGADWFAADGTAYFDAGPHLPPTLPLLQVWGSIALGRWDDALMNLPWWLTGVAFAVAMYGALRMNGLDSLAATVGAWLTSSLPLANVHIALAGYADLPMASYYALAALATWRWSLERSVPSAVMALLFAIACMTIKTPGIVWALTLLPGIVLAVMPQRGPRVVAAAVAAVLLALAVLAQTHPMVLGYRLHLDFAPAWQALVDSLFLLGNWNLLWYAVIAATIVAWPILRTPAFVALSSTMASGVLFLFVAFAFTNARNWVNEQTTVNRAVLHLAPLALAWTIVVVHAWLQRRKQVEAPATLAPASA